MKIAGGSHRGREPLLQALHLLSAKLQPFSSTTTLLIQSSAAVLLVLFATLEKLERQLHELSNENQAIRCLCGHRGITVLTAATMIAEIVDVRRFPTSNHLASYAGLARHEHKTGRSGSEITSPVHNHRLKNAFFSAARNITLHNPDSHLAAYYRSLVKRGMPITEAHKRVGRALVRRIYRELKAISEQQPKNPEATEGAMVTGPDRGATKAPSDMTPSTMQYIPDPRVSNGPPPARKRSPPPSHLTNLTERGAENFA
jgi:transposase